MGVKVPILAMAASALDLDKELLSDAGFDDFLTKVPRLHSPIDFASCFDSGKEFSA
jgi:hypothetical protein